jgi:hypothetical protein
MPGRDGCLGGMDAWAAGRDEMPGRDGCLGRRAGWMPGRGGCLGRRAGWMPGPPMPVFETRPCGLLELSAENRDESVARGKKDERSAIKYQNRCLPCRRHRCT